MNKLSRRQNILLAIVIPTLLSLVALYFVLETSLRDWSVQRWSKDHRAFVAALGERVDADLMRATQLLRYTAALPEFAGLPERHRIDRSLNGLPEALDPGKRRALERLRREAGFSVLFVLTPEGDHYISHPWPVQLALKKYNLADRTYFQEATRLRRTIVSDSFIGADGVPGVAIDTPIFGANGEIVAHLGGVLHLHHLGSLLDARRIEPFESALLVDRRGQIVTRGDAKELSGPLPEQLAAHSHFGAGATSVAANAPKLAFEAVTDTTGRRWMSFHAELETGWHLHTFRRLDTLHAEVAPEVHKLALFAAGLVFLISLLGVFLAMRISRRWERAEAELKVAHDTLEKRVAERTEALGKSEERYRTLYSATADAVVLLDSVRFFDCNDAALKIFGARHPDEIRTRHPADLSPPTQPSGEDSRVLAEAKIEEALTTGVVAFDWVHRRLNDGEDFASEVLFSRMELDGRVVLQATVRDVSERKRAEGRLRLAAGVFDGSHDGIMVVDRYRKIIAVNPAFTRITGYAPEEVVGQTPRVLSSGRHGREFYETMWAAIERDAAWEGELWNRRKDGLTYPEWLSISIIRDTAGEVSHYIGVFSDISSQKADQERIHFLAYYDALTQLPNRSLLADRFQQAAAMVQRSRRMLAVLFIDLDRFKQVNDSLGHQTGDELLKVVAERLADCLRESDTLARLGGDEFVLLLPDTEVAEDAVVVAEKCKCALSLPVMVAGHELRVTPSIGIALCPQDGETLDVLLRNADTAMYAAKDAGRNTFQFFTGDMNARIFARMLLESEMRQGLERGEFVLHYQPQVDVGRGRIIGVEALVRWQHPTQGLVYPGSFIAVAEETGLIVPLGDWVLRQACQQNAAWQAAGLPPIVVAINVSALQFRMKDFYASIMAGMMLAGLDARWLELELTESILIEDVDETLRMLDRLKGLGVSLSVDDFGTGYSSLSYLKRFPVDKLKVDQSFVRDLTDDADDRAIAASIIAMGHRLGLRVVAEGVETAEHLAILRDEHCDEYQGYFFSRPVPADEIEKLLREQTVTA
jgi:diguanylate cyclase (GGDEF)-like protein/PAS domain S-box-containing protein